MIAYVLASLKDMLIPVAAMTVLFSALMVNPRTRHVTLAVIKFTNRHSPQWAKPAIVACALIPGQADEIALVAILLIPILRSQFQRRVLVRIIKSQWNKG